MKRFKQKKAQQLVEFLLIAPFIVILLGILTEYAYALNINMTLSQGLKTVTSSIYRQIKPSMTTTEINTLVKNGLNDYLSANNAPVNSENNLRVGYSINGQTAIFMANYTYIPAFSLPNVYFKIMPEKFSFLATSAVPVAFISPNNYDSSIDSLQLDGIWSSSANFSSQDGFNDSKKGIMKNTSGRNSILFLVPNPSTTSILGSQMYTLVDWDGTLLKSGANTYNVSTANGNIYLCSTVACNPTGNTFLNYATTNNYYNVFFVHDTVLTYVSNDLSDLSDFWINPLGSTDLSPKTVDGILKRTIAIINSSNSSIGNYDNLFSGSYKMEPFGSMIFIYENSTDNISKLTGGSTPKIDYNFGTRVN